MAGLAGAARWAVRGALAVVLFVVMSLGGLTHEKANSQFVGATTIPTGPAAQTGGGSPAVVPTADSPTASAPGGSAVRRWYSGGSSDLAANGKFGKWRGEPLTFAGTWDNGNEEMVALKSICGGDFSHWNKPLDIAIGAIDDRKGESWARAAQGAYDARWRRSLQRMKSCWGSRDPGKLYIRFAHEFNLKDMAWKVKGGQEADFVRALRRFSDLRYDIIPKAKIVLCPSDGTSANQGIDLLKVWPGKDAHGRQVIDVYGVDSYNSWVVARDTQEFVDKLNRKQNGQPLGLELHRQLAQMWGVPFAVCEWSGNGDPKDEGHGADLPIYYTLMNEWFRQNAGDPEHPKPGQLLYEIQFNYQPRFMLLPTKVQPKSAAEYRRLKWGE
jgi:hypothetical protein